MSGRVRSLRRVSGFSLSLFLLLPFSLGLPIFFFISPFSFNDSTLVGNQSHFPLFSLSLSFDPTPFLPIRITTVLSTKIHSQCIPPMCTYICKYIHIFFKVHFPPRKEEERKDERRMGKTPLGNGGIVKVQLLIFLSHSVTFPFNG